MTQYSGVYSLQTQGQAITSGQWATDPYYRNTTLLLHADGVSSGAQNNTFLDSSTNAFAITRAGNTTQGSFSPYGPTWSNYFDGTGDYIQNTTNYLVSSTTTTFTIEAWVFMTADPTDDVNDIPSMLSVNCGGGNDSTNYMSFGPISSKKLKLRWFDGSQKGAVGTTVLSLNTWYHVACSVSSNAIKIFLNGVEETLTGDTTLTNRSGNANGFALGQTYTYANYSGYISNARVLSGTALYSGAFNPTTVPFTTTSQGASNCVLLTCQSNRFVDNSSNGYAITSAGNSLVQRFSPFAPQYQYTTAVIGGSAYFDGTGDYLTSTAPALGTGNLTFEFWIYPLDGSATYRCVYDNRVSGDGNSGYGIFQYGAVIEVYNASLVVASAAASIKANAWNHVSFVRSSGTCQLYINGVASGSSASSTTNCYATDRRIATASTLAYYYYGYIADLRENATAVTPTAGGPTSPVPAISGTQLLLNMVGAGIYDNAMMNDLETVGNAQVSTSVAKYGSGSLAFDGSGDYLTIPPSPSLLLNGCDATVECWVYLTRAPGSANSGLFQTIFSQGEGAWYGGGTQTNWTLLMDTTNIYFGNNFATIYTTAYSPPLNTWIHIAAVKTASNNNTIYINGVSLGTQACSDFGSSTSFTNLLGLGYFGDAKYASYFQGYIDDFRITKGVARYTGNFIPPKVAFANQ